MNILLNYDNSDYILKLSTKITEIDLKLRLNDIKYGLFCFMKFINIFIGLDKFSLLK